MAFISSGMVWYGMVWYGMAWYGMVEFNVPLDTGTISEFEL